MAREEVEMLPSGIGVCLIDGKEVRMLKISPEKITVRTDEKIKDKPVVKTSFYVFDENRYDEFEVNDFDIVNIDKNQFFYTYAIIIRDKRYFGSAQKIIRAYSRYVTMKTYGDNNEFSKEMVGYPEELDYDYYKYYEDQKYDWFSHLNYDEWDNHLIDSIEIAVLLDNDKLYESFLKQDFDSFKEEYLENNYVEKHKLFKNNISRIYIGSEVCHNLFPDEEKLMKIVNKAYEEKLNITVCFTYMRNYLIDNTKRILNSLYDWCREKNKKIEIVINDWGMVELINEKKDFLDINLGILLNKRRKDPRYSYKKGFEENQKLISENSLNSESFRKHLSMWGIERYEYESCGYKSDIADGRHSLHFPFYVTNTSQYCTLHAMCTSLDRGCQKLVTNCPKYCRDYVFTYPKHLKMVGRYNSLFAVDDTLLKSAEELQAYIKKGIDRLVLNFI